MRILPWILILLAAGASAQTTIHTYDCSAGGTNCPSPLGDPPPGTDASVIVSEMSVPSLCGPSEFLTNIQPHVQLTHPSVGELQILVIAPPAGSPHVSVFDRPLNGTGSCSGDNLNVTFADGGPPFPCSATPPSNGVPVVAPAHPSLLDLAADWARTGTWSLQITDFATGNTGTLDAWSLTFTCDPKNTVSITASDATGNEVGDPIVFTVTRSGVTTVPLNVPFSLGGTASVISDYTVSTFSVRIPAGASSATITVTPQLDAAVEGPETVIASVLPTDTYVIGSPSSATATIADAGSIPALSPWALLLLAMGVALGGIVVMRR